MIERDDNKYLFENFVQDSTNTAESISEKLLSGIHLYNLKSFGFLYPFDLIISLLRHQFEKKNKTHFFEGNKRGKCLFVFQPLKFLKRLQLELA